MKVLMLLSRVQLTCTTVLDIQFEGVAGKMVTNKDFTKFHKLNFHNDMNNINFDTILNESISNIIIHYGNHKRNYKAEIEDILQIS